MAHNPLGSLREKLKIARRVFVLGVGSELLGDDSAGLLAALEIKNAFKVKQSRFKLKTLCAGTAPENFTGVIKKFKPTHLIIIDAADLGKRAGSIAILKPEEISGVTFSTHRLPTKILAQYLLQSLACEIIIIGIQPKSLEFQKLLSEEVKRAIGSIVETVTFYCYPSASPLPQGEGK